MADSTPEQPAERLLTVTRLAGYADTRLSDVWQGTWEAFLDEVIIADPEHGHGYWPGDKTKAPSFVPASFKATGKGAERKDHNVDEVGVAVFDYDDISASEVDALRTFAAEQQLRYCIYTSYSHVGGPIWRCRFILDLDRPVPGAQWKAFWQAMARYLPGKPDPKCKNPSRCYGLAYTPNLDDAHIEIGDGDPLAVDTVLEGANAPAPGSPDREHIEITQTVTRDELKRHVTAMKRRTGADQQVMVSLLEALLEGRPYAQQGERHHARLKLTQHLERAFPTADLPSLADLFDASHRAMRSGDPDWDPAAETDKAIVALEGARGKRQQAIAERQAAEASDLQVRIADAFLPTTPGRVAPYTDAEIMRFATEQQVTAEVMRRRWVVQHGSAFYFFVDGRYRGPFTKDSFAGAAYRDLAPAAGCETSGVRLEQRSEETGKIMQRPREDMIKDYGTVAENGSASFLAQRSHYDAATRTIVEAVCPRRPLTSSESKAVGEWLGHLAGPERLPFLLAWLKFFRDLRDPLPALYVEGPKGAGKSLLAAGLSRLWGVKGPTKADVVDDDFNSIVTDNPVVFADEYLPGAWSGTKGLNKLREFIPARTRSLKRKFLPAINLEGCLRVIIAANNQHLLTTRDALTENDRLAIAERLFHIPVRPEASAFLAKIGDARARLFVENDEIARHVLWLEQQHQARREGRFGVRPPSSELHRTMKYSHPLNAAVAQWLIGYLLDQNRRPSAFIAAGDGRFVVNVNALNKQDDWSRYVSNPAPVPGPREISNALGELTEGARGKLGNQNVRQVNMAELASYAEAIQLCGAEELYDAIAKPSKRLGQGPGRIDRPANN